MVEVCCLRKSHGSISCQRVRSRGASFCHEIHCKILTFSRDLSKPTEDPRRRGKKRRKNDDDDDDEEEVHAFEKAPRSYG